MKENEADLNCDKLDAEQPVSFFDKNLLVAQVFPNKFVLQILSFQTMHTASAWSKNVLLLTEVDKYQRLSAPLTHKKKNLLKSMTVIQMSHQAKNEQEHPICHFY